MIVTKNTAALLLWTLRNSTVSEDDVDVHVDAVKAIKTRVDPETDVFTDGDLVLAKAEARYLEKQIVALGKKGWPGGVVEDVPTMRSVVSAILAAHKAKDTAEGK